MFRTAGRALVRSPAIKPIPAPTHVVVARRTLFGGSARKSGPGPKSLKSAAVRWAAAAAGMYYYLTSSVFAEENTYFKSGTPPSPPAHPAMAVLPEDDEDDEDTSKPRSHRSLDDIRMHSRTTGAISDPEDTKLLTASEAGTTQRPGSPEELDAGEHAVDVAVGGATTPEELEEEAEQQGAFNPETGEINWDCPCLGGMAHGPCGEEFKVAFSCFVYSSAEPKGVDCIEKFKGMQDCFRKYPEHYGAELGPEEDDDDEDELASAALADDTTIPSSPPSDTKPSVPLTASQVQEKVRTEAPVAVKQDQETIPALPESPEQLTTEQVKEKVKAEVPPPAVESK